MKTNIISLITDFSFKDQYVGLVKAVILRINPKVRIIDLCHNIPPQDITRAAYMLKAAYKYFPQGTIHVAVVDPGVGTKRRIICLKASKQYFIAPDNGLLSLIVEETKPESIINITNKRYFLKKIGSTFHGRDIFAPVAGHISKGMDPKVFGEKIGSIKRIDFPKPVVKDRFVIGEIIYIDGFGNLVTNVDENTISNLRKDRKKIKIKINQRVIYGLKESYADVKTGELLAIIGSIGNLEISANKKNAKKALRAKRGDKVKLSC